MEETKQTYEHPEIEYLGELSTLIQGGSDEGPGGGYCPPTICTD